MNGKMGFKVIRFMAVALIISVLVVSLVQADGVIIVKGDHTVNRFINDANHAYNETKNHRGFSDDNITYLNGNTTPPSVDGLANKTNLRNAVNNSKGNLTIYLRGHGNTSRKPATFICGPDEITTAELKNWIDQLQNRIGAHITVIIDSCGSGDFILNLSGKNRTIIASTNNTNVSWSRDDKWSYFGRRFWTEISNGTSLRGAFNNASDEVKKYHPDQIPQYDDNGDGVGYPAPLPNGGDGANDTYIGISAVYYGKPVITDIVPPKTALIGDTVLIWAHAHAMEVPPTVYAFVKYPSWVPPSEPCDDFPTIKLTDLYGYGNYTGTYEVTETGNYMFMVCAEDWEGGISASEVTSIYVLRSGKLDIEAVDDVVGKGEDIVLTVEGNPKTYYYVTVTGVDVNEPPEIKTEGDVKALSGNAVISATAPNLAAWIQTGDDGIAEVKIATIGADDRTYTIHVYETTLIAPGGAAGNFATDAAVADAPSTVTTDYDDVDIKVSEKLVIFDMKPTVVIGEDIEVRGTANAGDFVDIAIEDYIVETSIPIAEDGTFEGDLPTPETRGTGAPGSIRIEAFIRMVGEPALSGDVSGVEEDGSTSIRLSTGALTAEISVSSVAQEDSFEVEGTAEGSDFVDILTIAPKGGGGKGIDPTSVTDVPGMSHDSSAVSDIDYSFSKKLDVDEDADTGKYIIVVLSPGRDGKYNGINDEDLLGDGFEETYGDVSDLGSKTQEQIVSILKDATIDAAGSDDLIWVGDIKVETPFVTLNPIADVGIGEPLVVTGTTNREEGFYIVVTVKGPIELEPQTVKVENDTFNVTFDTSDAVVGTYTIEADDGDGHTDTATVEIGAAVPPSEP
jgi:hypothetical protein